MSDVAIAVPSLNQAQFLAAALDSMAGSHVSVSRAVLDAGSTDGSRELIQARTAELAFWRSAPDGGQAVAINEGIDQLCGAHPEIAAVGWLNADDMLLPHGLDRLWQALVEQPGWSAVSGRATVISAAGAIIGEARTKPFSPERFARGCTICQPATLIRRSAWERVGGLDASLEMCFDYDLWWRLSRVGTIGFLDDFVAATRDHDETKTRRRRARYFREATAVVTREIGTVPWHWYISEALERQVQYQVGRRPPVVGRIKACVAAAAAFARDSTRRLAG